MQEQTGLYAGKGGFDIAVGNHTQLSGALIASTADNWLDTGTLGFSNLNNAAAFTSQSQSIGFSTSNPVSRMMSVATSLTGGNNSGQASSTTYAAVSLISRVLQLRSLSSTTYAAVSAGTIAIHDTQNQQQNVEDLSRDVEHAANGLSHIFDKEKELQRLQHAKLMGDIGAQMIDIIRVEGEINVSQAAKEASTDPETLKAAQAQLKKDG